MIRIELIEALQKQIEFCKKENNYMCGIYVNSEGNKNTVLNLIYFLTRNDTKVKIKNNTRESFVGFDDRSFIKIIKANNYARGHRFNGMIIDSQISKEIVNTIVLPRLVPLRADDNIFYTDDKPMDRVYYCNIEKI